MATTAEIKAAIAAAEAKGRTDLADKLRAYLPAEPTAPDVGKIEEAIAAAEKKNRPDLVQKLRAYLPKPDGPATAAQADPVAGSPEAVQMAVDDFALFEMANPQLRGRYTPETMPKVGEMVIGTGGGGGRSGAPRVEVQPWRNVTPDTFGDTAGAMMEGPVAAMKAFGGGLAGGDSPARNYLANDPLTRNLPGPVLTGLGAVGDAGGAALSGVGAGLSGAIGLATELMPGQSSAQEEKLGNDLLGMSMMAVPELAGVSSIPARMATAAPKVAAATPKVAMPSRLAGDVAAAERLGIPVMRTDVKPPATFIGKSFQRSGEAIPFAGTGGMRAKQNAARLDAVTDFVTEYVPEAVGAAIDDVTASFQKVHGATVRKYAEMKNGVINSLADKGPVPVPKAVAAIDEQIARLKATKNDGMQPIIAELEGFKKSITDQALPEVDANRAYIGKVFKGLDASKIRDAGEKALSAIYGPLKEDMGAFIKQFGGATALNKWGVANKELSTLAGEVQGTSLATILKKGEVTPEVSRQMLFSKKPSDLRLLSKLLDDEGKAAARTAIVQEALGKSGGLDDLAKVSPDQFKQALGKLGNQVSVFFKGEDFAAADGLLRALQLTEQAARAGVSPPTGLQNLPLIGGMLATDLAGGMGGASALLGTIGGIARVYEATGVKAALRAVSRAETPKAQSMALQSLDKALLDTGAISGNAAAQGAANSTGRPEYEGLWSRYGQ